MFKLTAVASIMWVLSVADSSVRSPADYCPTQVEVEAMCDEAVACSGPASQWCGYFLPPELMGVLMLKEGGGFCLQRHCEGGGPRNDRSTGYFAMTVRVIATFGPKAQSIIGREVWLPDRPKGITDDEWRQLLCKWVKNSPKQQVRILFTMLAYHAKYGSKGSLFKLLEIYRNGEDPAPWYPPSCKSIWKQYFRLHSWPNNYKLEPVSKVRRKK